MPYRITSSTNRVWEVQAGKKAPKSADDLLKILAENRGISDINEFTSLSVKNSMPEPFHFLDMEKAVNRIEQAIQTRQKIAILGDYDVDGVSATAILVNFLDFIGADYTYSIPNRMDDGYGLNIKAIETNKDCLIIAVDCGSNSTEELAYAKKHEIDVIVIDHHKMLSVPKAIAVVNPHRPDEKGKYTYLCATGLVFICVVGVSRSLRNSGFYSQKQEPDLIDYLDLVALATVCDVVSLTELNKAFVSTGLKVIRKRKNFGIDALLSLYRSSEINSETISFFLGPRLNASGRIATGDISVKLLTTKNPIEAKRIAEQLDSLNKERQLIEKETIEEALCSVDENLNFVCSYAPHWHVGIIGIVAGRLKEKYNKLSIVISNDENGKGKASCRSVDGVDISTLINKGIERGIISSGGGHSMAAGFSIELAKIPHLIEFLKEEIKEKPLREMLYADCILTPEIISTNLLETVSLLEPFGMGNRRPKFVIPNLKITSAKIVGEKHIATVLEDSNGHCFRAISFRATECALGNVLLNKKTPVDVLGTLCVSVWNNERYVNLQLEDVADSNFC